MRKRIDKKRLLAVALLVVQLLLTACGVQADGAKQESEQDWPYLRVDFIDVGQADFIIVECDGVYMTIDAGNVADSNIVYSHLKQRNITEIDTVIITHAHEDHCGGVNTLLNYTTINKLYCPDVEYDTYTFRTLLHAIREKGIEITVPVPGESFSLGSALVQIFGPIGTYEDLNNSSIVVKVTFGERSFLFTGDAEREAEADILNAGVDVSAEVLKIGHHGSYSSTSYVFLKAVAPRYAVISSDREEFPEYNHPHEVVVSRLRDADVEVYRTDLQGTITFITFGDEYAIFVEKNPDADTLFDAGGGSGQ